MLAVLENNLKETESNAAVPPAPTFTVVSFGAGLNSSAVLVGLRERGERPDAIVFADTGGERPETYAHRDAMNAWCKRHGFPEIVTVRKGGRQETLEENCLRMKMLPSLAYGFKGCSHKYKIEPQEQWANNHDQCKAVWKAGGRVLKLIGYDADEHHRAKIPEDKKYTYRYPLVEWDWGREDCAEAIKRAGICLPGKSACFFCPATRVHEIRAMAATHPDLVRRALEIEANAELTAVHGLGRSFAWGKLLATEDMFSERFSEIKTACGCYDG